jgi:phosphate transport system protein
MPEKFDKEVHFLHKDIKKLGELSSKMLIDGVESLRRRDGDLAQSVIDRKDELYDLDDHIEEHSIRVLTLHQPVAKDMRELACILKMITNLKRIGRYGYDIAKVTLEIKDQKHVKRLIDIPNMAKIAVSMIEDVLEAYFTEDLKLLEDIEDRDDILDEERYSIFRECLTYMMEDPKTITRCTHYVMVARYLERCGDHACNIAEKVYFRTTGERREFS